MRRIALLIGLALAMASCRVPVPNEPDLIVDCKFMVPGKMWNMCITQTVGSTNHDVIFHFHGATGNEKHWVKLYKEVRDIWRARGFEAPAVATVNFGPTWFLAEKNSSPWGGLFQFYENDIMPWVEEQLGYKIERKFALGESMGGFNVAQYYFKRPKLFEKVAILCPAFTNWGPQSTNEEVDDYITRTSARKDWVGWLRAGFKAFFPKDSDWANADVYQLAEKYTGTLAPLLLSCGTEDNFGFYEGTSKMVDVLSKRSSAFTWKPIPGDHCVRPFEDVADFFQ